jgi:hypothetical protein
MRAEKRRKEHILPFNRQFQKQKEAGCALLNTLLYNLPFKGPLTCPGGWTGKDGEGSWSIIVSGPYKQKH